jgi:hypothetical protein
VNTHLWRILEETNGDAIIRELRLMYAYPAIDESLRSTSPWFKVELKGTYYAGIEVFLSIEQAKIADGVARPTSVDDPEGLRGHWCRSSGDGHDTTARRSRASYNHQGAGARRARGRPAPVRTPDSRGARPCAAVRRMRRPEGSQSRLVALLEGGPVGS